MLNLPLAPAWAKLLRIPRPYLYAGILFFASLGAYAVNLQSVRPVPAAGASALLGFMMRRFGLPVLPLIIGVILGPRIERQLRTGPAVAGGDVSTLWSEPLAVAVYVIIAVLLLWPAAGPSGGVRPGRRPSFKDA